jgi:hypothetical protein
MKKIIILLTLALSFNSGYSQSNWFKLYTDSTALVKDGNMITYKFIADVKKIKSDINFDVKTVLNTTPYLIYFDGYGKIKTANLPLWQQVIPQQKQFFYEVAGDETKGKNAFGYFFNGFYLPHELGHALQQVKEGNVLGSYDSEYLANIIAILWWRKMGRSLELKQCYESAKVIWTKLPNPVPQDTNIKEYFTKNYQKATENPYTYGYMQFKQFIDIYENKDLPSFDVFIANYLNQKQAQPLKF